MSEETIQQLSAKLEAWRARHPQEVIKRLGFALIDLAHASGRAEKQIAQSLRKPMDKTEEEQARNAFRRLFEERDAYNREAALAREVFSGRSG